jgi:hypothetical protein
VKIRNILKDSIAVHVNKGASVSATTGRQETFVINAHLSEVAKYARKGNDLVITFIDGSQTRINGYTTDSDKRWGELVFHDGDRAYLDEFVLLLFDMLGNAASCHVGMPLAAPMLVVGNADGHNRIEASGTAVPGSMVTVQWPDGSTSQTTAGVDGSWSIESPTPQDSGDVTASARDAAGNQSPNTTACHGSWWWAIPAAATGLMSRA